MGSANPQGDTGLSSLYSPPPDDEIEVSLFGPGYGECALIHVGDQRWVVVDSCLDPDGQPAALSYLNQLGSDPADSVCLIVTTHWHDDHIRGMAQVVETCANANFCCANAFTQREFLSAVGALESRPATPEGSGVRELFNVLDSLNSRSVTPLYASLNRLIYQRDGCAIWTLSPSDAMYQTFLRKIHELLPAVNEPKRRIPSLEPNDASVVLLIDIGGTAILLGGDLETQGWLGILDNDTQPSTRASVFKVPHHGSENAHVCRVWEEMLERNPIAILTPWRRGGRSIPTSQGIDRILSHTDRAYITASPQTLTGGSLRRRDRMVQRTIRESGVTITNVSPATGMVRLRRKMTLPAEWQVETIGEGCDLLDV